MENPESKTSYELLCESMMTEKEGKAPLWLSC